ncbi:MAG: SPOR domain-containing protein [Rhodanobacter sp.]|jgi:hypothetical protein
MFLRLLFVLLIALNIAVGAWLLLGQPYRHLGYATDPGVAPLQLLSELPVEGGTVSVADAPADAAIAAQDYRCVALGPFDTPQDLRGARQALDGHVARMRPRQQQTAQPSAWWVYLPAAANRAQALQEARRLAAKNIGDYFVVGSGDQANTVSLGLFRDPANARKRLDQVTAAGFPARMSERSESVPEYWLDLATPAGEPFDWRRYLGASDLEAHDIRCF